APLFAAAAEAPVPGGVAEVSRAAAGAERPQLAGQPGGGGVSTLAPPAAGALTGGAPAPVRGRERLAALRAETAGAGPRIVGEAASGEAAARAFEQRPGELPQAPGRFDPSAVLPSRTPVAVPPVPPEQKRAIVR